MSVETNFVDLHSSLNNLKNLILFDRQKMTSILSNLIHKHTPTKQNDYPNLLITGTGNNILRLLATKILKINTVGLKTENFLPQGVSKKVYSWRKGLLMQKAFNAFNKIL